MISIQDTFVSWIAELREKNGLTLTFNLSHYIAMRPCVELVTCSRYLLELWEMVKFDTARWNNFFFRVIVQPITGKLLYVKAGATAFKNCVTEYLEKMYEIVKFLNLTISYMFSRTQHVSRKKSDRPFRNTITKITA